jgi:hypothetical protein
MRSSTRYVGDIYHETQLTIVNKGPLSAYFRAQADFLINYSPFHFIGDVSVSVGISFTLDLWICTIHISIDIGAQLHLQGPPFGGYVYVDFWVFGFTVHFGDSGDAPAAIDLTEFWQLLLQQPGDVAVTTDGPAIHSVPTVASDPTVTPTQHIAQIQDAHVLVVEAGRHPGNSKTKDIETQEHAPWIVRAQGFQFRVQSLFAIGTASANRQETIRSPNQHIYAKPLHLVSDSDATKDQSIESTLTITITGPEELGIFKCEPVIKKVPKALWGDCEFVLHSVFEQFD